jgi:hypothetical protein
MVYGLGIGKMMKVDIDHRCMGMCLGFFATL